jgi:NAD(P)H-flavin reductase
MREQPMTTALAADPMLPRPYRIRRLWLETKDTFTFDLEPADGAGGLSFAPGQFNMLYLFGVGEVPISISGDPGGSPVIRHTTRAVGTVTKAMRGLKRGDIIGVRGPFGSQWPVKEATGRDIVVVAGGIGLAPLRSVLHHLMAHRDQYGRVMLLYGARTPEDILYRRELEQWRGKFDLEVHVTVDHAASGWHGNVGVVTKLIGRVPFDPLNALAMICGPEVMMRFTIMELHRQGVAADRTYLSMEHNMKCAVGFCGHCQYGPVFICKDGPVFRFDRVAGILGVAEI